MHYVYFFYTRVISMYYMNHSGINLETLLQSHHPSQKSIATRSINPSINVQYVDPSTIIVGRFERSAMGSLNARVPLISSDAKHNGAEIPFYSSSSCHTVQFRQIIGSRVHQNNRFLTIAALTEPTAQDCNKSSRTTKQIFWREN